MTVGTVVIVTVLIVTVVIVTVVIVTVLIVTVLIVTAVIVTKFSKKQLDTLTNNQMFEVQRFAILVMFLNIGPIQVFHIVPIVHIVYMGQSKTYVQL